MGHREEGGDETGDMALDGWMEGRLAAGGPSRLRPRVTVLDEEEGFLLAAPFILVWPPVLTVTCLHLPGEGKGQSTEGGVDWCLDKVRERQR